MLSGRVVPKWVGDWKWIGSSASFEQNHPLLNFHSDLAREHSLGKLWVAGSSGMSETEAERAMSSNG